MKFVIAPDSFKGGLTAKEAATAMATGIRRVFPDAEYALVPMADGGEGTVQSLVDATDGQLLTATVTGPLGDPVTATYGLLGDGKTAVIEMAAASGIQFVDDTTHNPLVTTTYGTGELIRAALGKGVSKIILGIGGSATNDGGAGMAQAIGIHLRDARGQELPYGGAALANLATVDVSERDPRLADVELLIASDVTNPLVGDTGASAVFGPQKGATPDMVATLDAGFGPLRDVIHAQMGPDLAQAPGAGAAGGLRRTDGVHPRNDGTRDRHRGGVQRPEAAGCRRRLCLHGRGWHRFSDAVRQDPVRCGAGDEVRGAARTGGGAGR